MEKNSVDVYGGKHPGYQVWEFRHRCIETPDSSPGLFYYVAADVQEIPSIMGWRHGLSLNQVTFCPYCGLRLRKPYAGEIP